MMFKQFLKGLVFGAGFSIAFVFIYTIWYTWAFPKFISSQFIGSQPSVESGFPEVNKAPELSEEEKYLGTMGSYSGDFLDNRAGVLAEGEGKIVGKITVHTKPVRGVRVRLALNGSVYSRWAESDSDGKYILQVPYGEYRIDGYEIDIKSANKYLKGKINNPQNRHSRTRFVVELDKDGMGVNLDFVEPVKVIGPEGEISLTDEIIARWEDYPGATTYVVQLYENEDLYQFASRSRIFNWQERPQVSEPKLNLKEHGLQLKKGFYYTVAVMALDSQGKTMSETPHVSEVKHFKVSD